MNCFKVAPSSPTTPQAGRDALDGSEDRDLSVVNTTNGHNNMFSRTEQTSKSFSSKSKLTNPLSLFTKSLISSKTLSTRISSKSESQYNSTPATATFGSLASLPSKADLENCENEKVNELQFQLSRFPPKSKPSSTAPHSQLPRPPPEIKRSQSHGATLDGDDICFRRDAYSANCDHSPEAHRRFAIPSGESDIFLPKQSSVELPPCPEDQGYKIPRGLIGSDSSELAYLNTKCDQDQPNNPSHFRSRENSTNAVSKENKRKIVKPNSLHQNSVYNQASKRDETTPNYTSLQSISSRSQNNSASTPSQSQHIPPLGDANACCNHVPANTGQPIYSTLDRVKNTKNEPVYEHYKTLPSLSSPKSLPSTSVPSPLATHRPVPVPPALPCSKPAPRSLPPLPKSPQKPPVPPKPSGLCSPISSDSNFDLPISSNEYDCL